MGMTGNFLRVSQKELRIFLKDSSKLEDIIYSQDEDVIDSLNRLDTDKAWDGIFYLLTGNGIGSIDYTDPSCMNPLLVCNQLIDGQQDLGYGPAHYINPNEVKEFSTKLSDETRESLYAKFDPADMEDQDVYPSIWTKDKDDAFEYIYDYFLEIKAFYKEASKADEAIIFFIN